MKYNNNSNNNIPKRYYVSIFWVFGMMVWINGHDVTTNAFQPRRQPVVVPIVVVTVRHRPLTTKCTPPTRSCRTIHHRRFSSSQQPQEDESDQSDPSITKTKKIESFINRNNDYDSTSTSTSSNNIETFLKLSSSQDTAAKTGTVNERLIAELQAATAMEQSNVGSSSSSSNGRSTSNPPNKLMAAASFFKSSKTDVERRAAIAEAQNLNGVNPITTLFGAIFALLCAYGLWYMTQSLASYFTLHPVSDSNIYFVERVTLLSRNIIMGLSALASGFFGVTGIGILLLAIRVGYGVVIGELDPTPIVSNPSSKTAAADDDNMKVDMSNVWDMMMNKSSKKGSR